MADGKYKFNIELSVLNHLGRNLYRNFITILGEAISNSWDADAKNVYITINREEGLLTVRDDGCGMTSDDFQEKFLAIGYSKRKGLDGKFRNKSVDGRPFIGAKGVGKLALLSCSQKVRILSKARDSAWIGAEINNDDLDDAIERKQRAIDYPLGDVDVVSASSDHPDMEHGTIIIFDNLHDGIRNKVNYIKQQIAMHFRFSLVDPDFSIYVNDELVSPDDLKNSYSRTEFLWTINGFEDSIFDHFSLLENRFRENIEVDLNIKGFIASVKKPRDLSIQGLNERMGVDLLVNGRLRQRNILSLAPTSRISESYLHGQIFFDDLDSDETDRFVTSREGVKEDDEKFVGLIETMRSRIIQPIVNKWDEWRIASNQDGDDEDKPDKKARKARSLFNLELEDYTNSVKDNGILKGWIKNIRKQAEFNVPSYVQMFLSENLIREYIRHKNLNLNLVRQKAQTWKSNAQASLAKANISYSIRDDDDLSYLDMNQIAEVVDGPLQAKKVGLSHDALEFKPPRDCVAHTAILNDDGKKLLSSTYRNIVARINNLLKSVN